MPETTIWLVRHAETTATDVFNGAESDVGLSDLGFRQADALAEWFRPLAPTVVVSSAMRRALDTARPVAEACGVPHVVEADLHERRVGTLGGQPFSQAEGPWAETLERWAAGETAYTTPGAESLDELRSRTLPAFRRVAERFAGQRVVVIAHGVVCKVLLLGLLPGHGPADWVRLGRVANVSVSELATEGPAWLPRSLLQVPATVAALDLATARGWPATGTKSVG